MRMRESVKEMFLDWFNNYLTYQAFADAHGLDYDHALVLIGMGKLYHEEDVIK